MELNLKMVYFIKKYLLQYYSVIAFNRFMKKDYNRAIPLFKKVIELDPGCIHLEYIYSRLGRCFLAVRKYEDALEMISKAYELYGNEIMLDDFEFQEYSDLLNSYIIVLKHFNKSEQAKKIETEAETIRELFSGNSLAHF